MDMSEILNSISKKVKRELRVSKNKKLQDMGKVSIKD
jgi:hypothetical protein